MCKGGYAAGQREQASFEKVALGKGFSGWQGKATGSVLKRQPRQGFSGWQGRGNRLSFGDSGFKKVFFGGKATGFRGKGCLNKVKMLRIFLFAAKKESKTAAVPMRRAPAKGPEGPFGNPKGQ